MIKGSSDFMGRSPSSYHPAKFGDHCDSDCISGDTMVLDCDVIWQDHGIKAPDDLGRSPSR